MGNPKSVTPIPSSSPPSIPSSSPAALAVLEVLERGLLERPQIPLQTHHYLWAGVYYRWVCMPEGVVLTGAVIRIPTLLTLSGDVSVWVEGTWTRYTGVAVLPCEPHRKSLMVAHIPTHLLMGFGTAATTADEAEREFCEHPERLLSRAQPELNSFYPMTSGGDAYVRSN